MARVQDSKHKGIKYIGRKTLTAGDIDEAMMTVTRGWGQRTRHRKHTQPKTRICHDPASRVGQESTIMTHK